MYTLTTDSVFEIIIRLDFVSLVRFSGICRDIRQLIKTNIPKIDKNCIILDDLGGLFERVQGLDSTNSNSRNSRRTVEELNRNVTNEVVREILLNAGVEPNATTFLLFTQHGIHYRELLDRISYDRCLMISVKLDNLELMQRSLKHANNRKECFLSACGSGSNKVLKKLVPTVKNLSCGIDKCITGDNNRGILLLLRDGATVTKENIRTAIRFNRYIILDTLLENFPKFCNFAAAVSSVIGNAKLLRLSIDHGATNHFKTKCISLELEHTDVIEIFC